MHPFVSSRTLALLGVVLASAVAGCKKDAPVVSAPRPKQQVAVVVAQTQTLPIEYRFIGMTEPSRTVEIRSRITGFLLSRSFQEGQAIKAGDPLFLIDPRPFQADLDIVKARQAQAEARVSLAESDLRRYNEASKVGAVSKAELEKAETELIEARAAVNLAKAEVAKGELDLSYTKILSPVTGVIGRALKDEGSYLDAGNNSLLAVATQTNPMYVVFSVPERDWLRWRHEAQNGIIRPGFKNEDGSEVDINNPSPPVKLELLDGSSYPQIGRLNFVDTRIDAGTGSVVARASFENPGQQLKAGLFVHATITGWERPDSIVVPQRAVLNNPAGSFVFVVNDKSVVEMHKVTLGEWKGSGWLLLSGVKPGDVVIADGFAKAPPGTEVTTVPFVEASAKKPDADTNPPASKPAAEAAPAAN